MTRTEAIALINSKLPSLDDERVQTVAEIVANLASDTDADTALPRPLSPREQALLAQSREDFKNGRTYSHDEIVAMLDERLALHGVPNSTA